MGKEGAGSVIGPNHEGENTFKSFNEILVAFETEQAYSMGTEPDTPALFEASASVSALPHLSPREKRKVFLEIANPRPNAEGVIRTRISLFHAERHIRNGRAVRVDDTGAPSTEGNWIVFRNPENVGTKVTAEWLTRRVTDAPSMPQRVRTAAEVAADQRAIQLWPVLPNYTEGRPMEDFLTTWNRSKKSQSASAVTR